jgi:hypothetical protein
LETAGLPLNLRPCIRHGLFQIRDNQFTLLGFPVWLMLPAVVAELLHFQTLGGRLLIFRVRIVPVLAFLTLERDDLSRHFA